MDFPVDILTLAVPALIILAFIVQFILLLHFTRSLTKAYPAHKNTIYVLFFIAFAMSLYPYYYYGYSNEAYIFFLKSLLSIPLVFFLPGYLAYNAFMKEGAGIEPPEILFLQVMGSVLLSGWIGLILAELGFFSLMNLCILLLLFCCIIKFKFHVKLDLSSFLDIRIDKGALPIIGILLLSIILFFHPYPWILGNLDQGTYVNTGVNIANTGSIIVHDSLMGSLGSDLVDNIFYVFYLGHGVQYPGFYLTDNPGTVIPQFFYLWPTWIAIFYSMFGLSNSFFLTPVIGLLSVFSIYFAGKTLFNKNVGLLASLLLSINFAQIWYSRDPMSEMLTMLLFFSGLSLFILFMKNPSQKYFGVLSAFCIGGDFLTRIDTVFIAIPFILYFGYLWFYDRLKKEHWYFIIPLVLLIAHTILTAVLISWPYTDVIFNINITNGVQISSTIYLVSIGSILLSILIVLMAKYKKSLIIAANNMEKYSPYLKHGITLLLISGVIFAYFIRPSGDLYTSESYNFVKLSWYLAGLFGILLATAGFILIIYKRPFNEVFIFLSVLLIYTVFYVISIRNDLWQPWWVRRFLPVVIPAAIICIAYLIDWARGLNIRLPKPMFSVVTLIPILLVVFLAASFMVTDYKILNFTQYGNSIDDVANISKLIDNNSIILYRSNQYTDMLAVPLHYIYGDEVVSAYMTNQSIDQIVKWMSENKSIYLLGFDGFGQNDSDNSDLISYTTNWTIIQDPTWGGRFDIHIPGDPRVDRYTYTFQLLNNSSDLSDLTLLYFNDTGWSDVFAWEHPPNVVGENNASVTIYSMNNKTSDLIFDLKCMYPDSTLEVYLNGNIAGKANITTNYSRVELPVNLMAGDNTVMFYSMDSPQENLDKLSLNSNDSEDICFTFEDIMIE